MYNMKLLSTLYQYKAMGFSYFDDINSYPLKSNEISHMPNSLTKLQEYIGDCVLCNLSKGRKNVVFGEGKEDAKLMFIGEGPGEMEDNIGRVFVGRAGQLLDKIINNVLLLQREDVYIANIVKCRPPNNRAPTEDEASLCSPFLIKQIEIVKPEVIVALGSSSYRFLTGDLEARISRVRGEIISFMGAKLMPTYHPSYLLRNPSAKRYVMQDMLKVKALI